MEALSGMLMAAGLIADAAHGNDIDRRAGQLLAQAGNQELQRVERPVIQVKQLVHQPFLGNRLPDPANQDLQQAEFAPPQLQRCTR
ncbi:hypothetical protein G6F23_014727 [Rhizopus arrhizus]|nr:hypothetical protein G6F23_014727 [Rhizopus arrhizus]